MSKETAPSASVPVKQAEAKQPAAPFDWLRQEVDHLFDEFFHHQQRRMFDWPTLGAQRVPSVDLDDKGGEFCLTAELPGFEVKDVTLEIKDGSLRIAANREDSKEERSDTMLLRERRSGSIERLVPLPQAVEMDKATASLKEGVLTVTLPKKAEVAPAAQQIPIQA